MYIIEYYTVMLENRSYFYFMVALKQIRYQIKTRRLLSID